MSSRAEHKTTATYCCAVVIQCNGTIIVTHRLLDDKGTYRSFHLDLKVQHDFRQILWIRTIYHFGVWTAMRGNENRRLVHSHEWVHMRLRTRNLCHILSFQSVNYVKSMISTYLFRYNYSKGLDFDNYTWYWYVPTYIFFVPTYFVMRNWISAIF